MKLFGILIIAILGILFFILGSLFACFYIAFYSKKRVEPDENTFPIPDGDIYEPFRDNMVSWIKETRQMPCRELSIVSFDGLTLRGRYYECTPTSPIEIMFPGYRGSAERDLSGGVQRCFKLGHNALIVDQRAGGRSDGHIISFGVNEAKDCRAWVDYAINYFGPETKIILTGISMGAATVMLTAGSPLPKNVIGVLADCGYSSAPDIIKKVMKDLKLPVNLLYPMVRLAGKLYGHFDLEDADVLAAVQNATVPMIFIHGETDDFVPHDMSKLLYENCPTKKLFVSVPGAGHGLGYPMNPEGYIEQVHKFWQG